MSNLLSSCLANRDLSARSPMAVVLTWLWRGQQVVRSIDFMADASCLALGWCLPRLNLFSRFPLPGASLWIQTSPTLSQFSRLQQGLSEIELDPIFHLCLTFQLFTLAPCPFSVSPDCSIAHFSLFVSLHIEVFNYNQKLEDLKMGDYPLRKINDT